MFVFPSAVSDLRDSRVSYVLGVGPGAPSACVSSQERTSDSVMKCSLAVLQSS